LKPMTFQMYVLVWVVIIYGCRKCHCRQQDQPSCEYSSGLWCKTDFINSVKTIITLWLGFLIIGQILILILKWLPFKVLLIWNINDGKRFSNGRSCFAQLVQDHEIAHSYFPFIWESMNPLCIYGWGLATIRISDRNCRAW
jgi:hypothetical protein